MQLTSTYEKFLKDIEKKYGDSEKIVCLLIMEPHNDEVSRYFDDRFYYYHFRTGKEMHFFCPGFNYENGKKIFKIENFVEFIKNIENLSTWRYYGGTNLLLIRYSNRELHFDSVYDLNLTRMLIEGIIIDYRHFIDNIIYNIIEIDRKYLRNEREIGFLKNEWARLACELFKIDAITYYFDNEEKINEFFTPHDFSR